MPKRKKKSIPIIALLFIIIPILVVAIAFLKTATSKTQYVYAKIKVSQGLWWATTAKPNIWLAKAIKKGEVEYNLLGKPIAEILEVRYYPVFLENQPAEDKYDIYLEVKLPADYNNRTQKYTFKRSTLSVGSPIDLETQSVQITGTVIEISEKEFQEEYTEKVIFLIKKFAFPWEYDAIKIGDQYFDGEEAVFEVLSKRQVGTAVISSDFYGNINPTITDSTKYIVVKAKVKVKMKDGQLLFGEEKLLTNGALLNISTPNFNFQDFVVGKIE